MIFRFGRICSKSYSRAFQFSRSFSKRTGGPRRIMQHKQLPNPSEILNAPGNLSTSESLSQISYSQELKAISAHSSLLNQTSLDRCMNLVDVAPMMNIFSSLPSTPLLNKASPRVATALRQTIHDTSRMVRRFPQDQRYRIMQELYTSLRPHLDQLSSLVISQKVSDPKAIRCIFSVYLTVDPLLGVEFYKKLPDSQSWSGAVIPCMTSCGLPFSEIKTAFEQVTVKCGGIHKVDDRDVCNMVWACLKYDQIDAAQILFDDLLDDSSRSVSPSVRQTLIDAFIGDGPFSLALTTFNRFSDHCPHHSAMERLVAKMWEKNNDIASLIVLFSQYLDRFAVPDEIVIKNVATAIVHYIVMDSETPEQTLDPIVRLCHIWESKLGQYDLILNIILTKISQKWSRTDEAKNLIVGILKNYDHIENCSSISYRVRLNALENLTGVDSLMESLWSKRNNFGIIEKWDWFSLARADSGGIFFQKKWNEAGNPFKNDIRRFCASKGYPL